MGIVVGAWGVHGDVKVKSYTDVESRFAPGDSVILQGRIATVVHKRDWKQGFILTLDIVTDRTTAESLRGQEITVSTSSLAALSNGSYYHYHLIGCSVWTDSGEHMGTLREIIATGANDVFVVREGTGAEVLVPAIQETIVDVDIEAKRITVSFPLDTL
ncbi:MAG: ribosome maturation factor RimM [SAR202 cluster bacterium]|nr:ribosome maturation factor RimM [SAR202 cluster bacterium]